MCFELIGAAHDKTAAVLPPPDQQRRLSTFRRCRRRGGLRIGTPHSEGHLDGDGQYFHYLTKWAFALDRMSLACGDPKYPRWAVQVLYAIMSLLPLLGPQNLRIVHDEVRPWGRRRAARALGSKPGTGF